MFRKFLLTFAAIVSVVNCEFKITVNITNETQVDLQTYLEDLEVAAASAQHSANLTAHLVNLLQELLKQKKVNCNCSDYNPKLYKEITRLPGFVYMDNINSNVGFKLNTEPLTWNEARKACEKEKSQLAVPRNYPEFKMVMNLKGNLKVEDAFLGLHSLFGKNDWLTVSGESVPTNHLASEEKISDGNCFCVRLSIMRINCNTPLPYFCEIR